MCMERWHYFFVHLMENLTLGSLHHWGKKPHDPLAQWTLETGQKNLCSWELNCCFSRCSAGGLAIVLMGQLYASARHARGMNPE